MNDDSAEFTIHPDDPEATGPLEPASLAADDPVVSEPAVDDATVDLGALPVSELMADDAAVPAEVTDPIARRRAEIDERQATVARVLAAMGCEAAILFVPAHVAWFTSGINVRGLLSDTERPGVYTNGRQRWLVCSNVDSQRLFDEELDQLGFQLKEWQWGTGRAVLLGELVTGKKIAADRPFPSLQLINDRLRTEIRPLGAYARDLYRELGELVAHALEATGRTISPGLTEREIAGQIAHRMYHHGVDVAGITVTADGRGDKFRRAGFTDATADHACVIQATGTMNGMFATASRTVCFGPPDLAFKAAYNAAARLSAVYRAMTAPGESVGTAGEAGRAMVANTAHEFEWRHSQPGYGTGWMAAEELRRMGQDERFAAGQALVWQARVGPAAVVDTVLVGETEPVMITPPADWPYKRAKLLGRSFPVPDLFVHTH
ncbi:M24 family metallopeptidase [Fimbriiglobus ruber]|uniref:Xaa-Pro aminopeptidase n=1 Tax=Fimbriiglobus ruber TaxID=1908690 RepID=A0A225D318_9BACT|nr:M24 family metallopeptidase [Fimbriiglobus ruber]OWK35902.1 Xaa-Pro aminopeptidase [Fimbriiglobus ruber]